MGPEQTTLGGAIGGVKPLDPSLLRGSSARLADDQRQFSSILAQHTDKDVTPEQAARKAAQQLVSTALVQPIFKRLRQRNNAAAPFGPNQAEKTFGSMLDAAYAERMVTSQNWGLVDQLARRVLSKTLPPGLTVTPSTLVPLGVVA